MGRGWMAAVDDCDRQRQRVLEAIYDLTDGQTLGELVDPGRLQEIVEIEDRAELDSTIHWLSDRGYAGYVSFGGIGIQPGSGSR